MHSTQNRPVVKAAVQPAAALEAAATRTNEPTTTFTETQLSGLVASAAAQATRSQAATPAPGGARDFDALTSAGRRRA